MGKKKEGATRAQPSGTDKDKIISVRVAADVHKRARLYALQTDTTFQAVLHAALEEYLKKHGDF